MAPGDMARLYHRLTSYSYVPPGVWPTPADDPLILQDFVPNDFTRWPTPCKVYQSGLPVVQLPRTWPAIETPTTVVLAGRSPAVTAGRLDLPTLARLLHLSAGVVRVWQYKDRPLQHFRAAGSAGGRSPFDLYLSAHDVDGLADGVHWYDPVDHSLVQVGPPATGDATTLVVTGIPWRTGWRYSERGFRHIYWDVGTMLAQTLALADSAGLAPRLWTRFADAEVSRLVGADGVHEFAVALVSLGDRAPAIGPQGDAAIGAVDLAPLEFPLVTLVQHAGDDDLLGDPWQAGSALRGEVPTSPDLDTVILQRGSTRLMDPTATVSRALFDFCLRASMRGTRVPHFIVVHAVEGLEPGLYRWPDVEQPVRPGPLREEMLLICWDMNLGRDAAFVDVAAIDLETLDDRGYREAQLDAGIVEGRLHLAAYGLGIGACGMTFLDTEVEGLLGEPLAGLLLTCVGVPTYRNKAGGQPGEPVPIVMPVAGETPRAPGPS